MAASAIKSVNMGELLTWVEQYAAENPSPKAGAGQIDACVIRDIVQSCVIQPFQVTKITPTQQKLRRKNVADGVLGWSAM